MSAATPQQSSGFHPAIHRLAVGTAQFGLAYGVANSTGKISQAEALRILRFGQRAGLDALDTAIAYGDSEAALGEAGVGGWRVTTKLPRLPQGIADIRSWALAQVQGSLERLGVSRVDGLLLHQPSDLLGVHGEALVGCLAELKATGMVGAAGISIYDPRELDMIWPLWQPDLVQAPCNVIDRRLISSGWLARLQRQGTRVHARSVFLQGLLLMPSDGRPGYFETWRTLLDNWLKWCNGQGVSPLAAALGFACGMPGFDRVIVGVESAAQLQEIVSAAGSASPAVPEEFACDDAGLVEPSRWQLA